MHWTGRWAQWNKRGTYWNRIWSEISQFDNESKQNTTTLIPSWVQSRGSHIEKGNVCSIYNLCYLFKEESHWQNHSVVASGAWTARNVPTPGHICTLSSVYVIWWEFHKTNYISKIKRLLHQYNFPWPLSGFGYSNLIRQASTTEGTFIVVAALLCSFALHGWGILFFFWRRGEWGCLEMANVAAIDDEWVIFEQRPFDI